MSTPAPSVAPSGAPTSAQPTAAPSSGSDTVESVMRSVLLLVLGEWGAPVVMGDGWRWFHCMAVLSVQICCCASSLQRPSGWWGDSSFGNVSWRAAMRVWRATRHVLSSAMLFLSLLLLQKWS